MNNVLIVGANLLNKGAQSMLFITVDEVKKRLPEAEIYFASEDIFDKELYNFKQVYYSQRAKNIVMSDKPVIKKMKSFAHDCQEFARGKRINLWRNAELYKVMPSIGLIIDVSGFAIGDKWNAATHNAYFDNIRIAKKCKIPIIMMPQSFGPFNYKEADSFLLDEVKEYLKYPYLIYARENEGFDLLTDRLKLNNVELSTDLVLQNKSVDVNNIYKKNILDVPKLESENAVAVIPNKQCFNHGDDKKNLELYKAVITRLTELGNDVYIFRHSSEDLEICRKIYRSVSEKGNIISDRVHLIEREFSCLEYDEFIKQFKFVICSRYHGLVHAYRNSVPCILLGWAVKYRELSEKLEEEEYCFDITDCSCTAESIATAVEKMNSNIGKERKTIETHLEEIRQQNCFDVIEESINRR